MFAIVVTVFNHGFTGFNKGSNIVVSVYFLLIRLKSANFSFKYDSSCRLEQFTGFTG